tara:strand:+ start:194 stop:373 length:180 start_codon:yes stop_codon:yes gene_type:complete
VEPEVLEEVEAVDLESELQEEQEILRHLILYKEQLEDRKPSQFMLVVEVVEQFVLVLMQ